MSMNREAYRLANEIKTSPEADGDWLIEGLGDMDMKKYEKAVLGRIRKERRTARGNLRGMAVAACAAVAVLAGTVAFGDEVHAALRQITWSIGNALGINKDLADYREVIQTSVTDQGYTITLQEAVVSEDSLVVNYTLQREDGQPMEQYLIPNGSLDINGKSAAHDGSGSAEFLDEAQTVLGIVENFHVPDYDLTGEHSFRLFFDDIGREEEIRGSWEFAFTADGTELMADTMRTGMNQEFQLPDGVQVKLVEYTSNDLEQRIFFETSGSTRYLLMIKAEDQMGNQVEFGVRRSDARGGYMQNEEIIDDGRLDENPGAVTMTLYAVELPEEDGRIPDDYAQIGEPFELEIAE